MAETSEVREVKDPAEDAAIDYAVEITIPTTLDTLKCGVRLASQGEGYYLSDWWVHKEGSFADHGKLLGGRDEDGAEVPFSTRRSAALDAAMRLGDKLAEIDLHDELEAQDDITRFMAAAEVGEVPELDEPEGDSLPSGDSPLSEADELTGLRGFGVEAYDLAMDIRTQEAVVREIKDNLKVANKKLELANEALTQCALDQKSRNRDMPLLDPYQNSAIGQNSEPEEPWRAVPIAELGLSDFIVGNLATNPDHAITTLGELADFEAALGIDNPLCSIPGIGASVAEKISEARLEWFRLHPPEGEGPLEEGE